MTDWSAQRALSPAGPKLLIDGKASLLLPPTWKRSVLPRLPP